MGFVLEQLERREAAALVRVKEARADALAAADRLDAVRIELSNLVIARLTVAGLEADWSRRHRPSWSSSPGAVRGPGCAGRRGTRRCTRGYAGCSPTDGRLRVKQVCEGLGLPEGKNATESVRSKLRRLADDGVLVRVEDGLFALAVAR